MIKLHRIGIPLRHSSLESLEELCFDLNALKVPGVVSDSHHTFALSDRCESCYESTLLKVLRFLEGRGSVILRIGFTPHTKVES